MSEKEKMEPRRHQVKEESNESDHRPLRKHQKVAYGAGIMIASTALSMWFAYIVTFFHKVLELPAKSTGTIVFIGQAIAGISAPLVVILSDHLRCVRRRKATYLVGAVAIPLNVFIWHECIRCKDTPSIYQTVYFTTFVAIVLTGCGTCLITMFSLIPELTTDNKVHVELNANSTTFSTLSHLLVFTSVWTLVATVGSGSPELTSEDRDIFMVVALLVVTVGLVSSSVFLCFTPESSAVEQPKIPWYKWFGSVHFYLVQCINTGSQVIYALPKMYMPLYFLDTLNMDKASIAKGPIVVFLSAFLASLTAKCLHTMIGLKMLHIVSQVIPLVSMVWIWLKEPTDDNTSTFNASRDSIYIAFAVLGVGVGMNWIVSVSWTVELVGKNTGSSSYLFGVRSVMNYVVLGGVVKAVQEGAPDSASGLPAFYRKALVVPVVAAVFLGLLSLLLLSCWEKWSQHTKDKGEMGAERRNGFSLGTRHEGDSDTEEDKLLPENGYEQPESP